MKSTFLLLLILSSVVLHAQKIEKYFNYNWQPVDDPSIARYYALIEKKDMVWSRKDYFLREGRLQMEGSYKDDDCKIAHGDFTYYYSNGNIESQGKYIDGKRYGTWLSFHDNGIISDSVTYMKGGLVMGTRLGWHRNGTMSDSTIIHPDGSGVSILWWENGNPSRAGRYAPGFEKHFTWQYFHSNGKLAVSETYNNGQIIKKECFDEQGVKLNDTATINRQATFPGGLKAWARYLEKSLYFPEQYKLTNGDQAVVMVRFAVNEDGSISDVVVTDSLHPDFDKIAVDVIQRSPRWIPALFYNRRIKEYHSQPVTFAQ